MQKRAIDTPRKSMPVNQVSLLPTDDLGVSVKCEGCGYGWSGRWVDDGGERGCGYKRLSFRPTPSPDHTLHRKYVCTMWKKTYLPAFNRVQT